MCVFSWFSSMACCKCCYLGTIVSVFAHVCVCVCVWKWVCICVCKASICLGRQHPFLQRRPSKHADKMQLMKQFLDLRERGTHMWSIIDLEFLIPLSPLLFTNSLFILLSVFSLRSHSLTLYFSSCLPLFVSCLLPGGRELTALRDIPATCKWPYFYILNK